jgi:pimeloyl-ACP methyl ester carboxylesterase
MCVYSIIGEKMGEMTARSLRDAYDLIRAGNKQEAQNILIPLVRGNPNSAEAWYLLGLALDDKQKQLYAFQQVLRIDPTNQHAQHQVARLQAPQIEKPLTDSTAIQPEPSGRPETSLKPVQTQVRKKPSKKSGFSPVIWGMSGLLGFLFCLTIFTGWWLFSNLRSTADAPLPVSAVTVPSAVPTATDLPPTPTLASTPTPEFTPVFRGTVCPFDIPLGTRVRCGVVSVPLDRNKNFTDLIDLPVVLFQSSKPDADVIIYLQGGPGQESIDWSLALFDVYVSPILQDFDMVIFDPRGTGRSEPVIDCPELNTIFIDAYFQNRSEDEAFKDFTDAWSTCHDRYKGESIDPAAFNTTQSAADVRDIARALGYEKVNLLGISYGTRLGLTVMRDYPEIVRAAVLDSVVPMEAKMFNRRSMDVQYALNKVFTDCAASPRCNKSYPDLANVFNNLIERFDKSPVLIKAYDPASDFVYDVQVNGVDMLAAFVWGLHTSELVPVVPKAIYDIKNGDNTFLSFALGVPGGTFDSMGLGTYFATVCPEQVYASTAEEMDADLESSELFKKFSLASLFGSSEHVFQICQAWGANPHDVRDSTPVHADTPTLIISGEYDPTTPVTTGQMVSDDLPNDYFYIIPGMGHGATVNNDCSLSIVMEFLKDPSQKPDSGCLDQLQSFEFFLPYDGVQPVAVIPITEHTVRMKGVVPVGWKKQISSNTYHRQAYLFDPTLVGFESFPAPESLVVDVLTQSFENSGFDETPAKIGSHSANDLEWTIYRTKFNGEPVLLALAQMSNRRTLALFMVVSAPEQQAFYKGLFLPMLDQLVPSN